MLDGEGAGIDVDVADHAEMHLGAETPSLGLHVLHQLRAQDPFWETRVVLHIGGFEQLAVRLVAHEHHRLQVGPGRVHRCRQARRARADDHHVVDFLLQLRHRLSPLVFEFALTSRRGPPTTIPIHLSIPRPWIASPGPSPTSSPHNAARPPIVSPPPVGRGEAEGDAAPAAWRGSIDCVPLQTIVLVRWYGNGTASPSTPKQGMVGQLNVSRSSLHSGETKRQEMPKAALAAAFE